MTGKQPTRIMNLLVSVTAVIALGLGPGTVMTAAQDGDDGFDDDSFDGGFGSFGADDPALRWSGVLRFDTLAFPDTDDPEKTPLEAHPDLFLDLSYEGPGSELTAALRVRPDRPEHSESAIDFARYIVDEAYVTVFYDRFRLQAGYLKQVWGTGDQLHVVDVLNSEDLRQFILPDYLERRLARPMLRLVVPTRQQGRLEIAYVPTFEPDRIPREGRWASPGFVELKSAVETAVENAITDAAAELSPPQNVTLGYLATVADAEKWARESVLVEPDTSTLEWGQYALRYRDTFGSVDLGIIYYHGFLKQPSVVYDIAAWDTDSTLIADGPAAHLAVGDAIRLDYDRVNVFGLEYAAVPAGFNTRAEAAYYLTRDTDGDDPTVSNNSIRYLAGFDRDLPLSNLNINVQGTGTYTLAGDEIDRNVEKLGVFDFEYDEDGAYTRHVVSAALTDSWNKERINPEIALSRGIETEDTYLAPKLEFILRDDMRVITRGGFFFGDEGYFGQFPDNDFAELRFKYAF